MATPKHNANGHRRRQLVARVKAEETTCALCGGHVNQNTRGVPGQHKRGCNNRDCPGCIPHPMSPVIDEDIPRSRGGSPYDRDNCHLMHYQCNGWKGAMTLAEAQHKRAGGVNEDSNVTPAANTRLNW